MSASHDRARARVRVKRERPDDAVPGRESIINVWEQRFQRLAALAFNHGVSPGAIAEILEAVKAADEPAEEITLWLDKRVSIEGKTGLTSGVRECE